MRQIPVFVVACTVVVCAFAYGYGSGRREAQSSHRLSGPSRVIIASSKATEDGIFPAIPASTFVMVQLLMMWGRLFGQHFF